MVLPKHTIVTFFMMVMVMTVTACGGWMGEGEEEPPLPGERISILDYQQKLSVSDDVDISTLSMPPAYENKFWFGTGLDKGHFALGSQFKQIWRADIGAGADEFPLMVRPVAADGFVYTVDAEGRLKKFDLNSGDEQWSVKVSPKDEYRATLGGGMSFNGNLLVANGFNEVLSIDAKNGGQIWRHQSQAPFRSAPVASGGRVFAVNADSETVALDGQSGEFLWRHAGLKEKTRYVGGASPVATENLVVMPYPSGELYGVRPENGLDVWSLSLTPVRRFENSLSQLGDIQANPIMDGGVIYAMSAAGTLSAIDSRTGRRIWQQNIGGSQTPWLAGDVLFVLNDENALHAFEKQSGKLIWVKALPRYEDEEEKLDPILFSGPIMAGGFLYVVGNHGVMYRIDPMTGNVDGQMDVAENVNMPPIIVNNTLLLLSDDGYLLAYR